MKKEIKLMSNKTIKTPPPIPPLPTLHMRSARNKKEKMFAALTSNNDDLFENNGRIIIWGKNKKDENIYLGDVSTTAIYQTSVSPIALIERIRFST